MKKAFAFFLAFLMIVGIISVPAAAVDYPTYDLVAVINGDGTVSVTAFAPIGSYSGKLVLSCSDKLSYVENSATCIPGGYLNLDYYKDEVSGICVSFAKTDVCTEKTEVLSLTYRLVGDGEVTAADFYSNKWDLTDGTQFIAKEHDGPISVNVSYKQYTVKFYGFDNQLIKEEVVNAGSDAVAPIAPVVEGYDFINWDKDFSKVQSDLTVRANYAIKTFTVTFTSDDTVQIVGSKTATVNYGTKFDDLPFPEFTSSSNSISDIGWEIQSGSYDPEKGVCSDITVVVTYKVVIGPDLPDDDYTLGDVNNDGYVDNIDAAIILKHDAGLVDINNYLQFAGDVNNDGYIDNIDAALILKLDAGLIEGF